MIEAFGYSMIHKWNLGRETAKRDAAERVDLAVASLDEWWYEKCARGRRVDGDFA